MIAIRQLLSEAVRLLRESSRHFKSRQVAEARRLVETALTQLQEPHETFPQTPHADAPQKIQHQNTGEPHD